MSIAGNILKRIEREKFHTTWISIFFNPYFFIRRGLYTGIRKYAEQLNGELLDFGCGQKPYEDLFKCRKYTGLDIEITGHPHIKSRIDVYYDGRKIPFSDHHFDSVFTSEVLTHIFNTEEIMPEINRVLKPGGLILVTVPFSWFENEIPFDNNRYTSFGIKYLLEKSGFEVIGSDKTTNFVQTLFQLANAYVFHYLAVNRVLRIISIPIIIFPLNLLGTFFSKIFSGDRSLYCNNIILARKIREGNSSEEKGKAQ